MENAETTSHRHTNHRNISSVKLRFLLIVLVLLSLAALLLLPLIGQTLIAPSVILQGPHMSGEWNDADIYWHIRLPRTLLALVAGGGLALAGLVLQAVFRNPLATPYTLGIASGASFGATLYLKMIGSGSLLLFGGVGLPVAAFGGAVLSMGIVYGLARSKNATGEQMLLAGVAVNFFFSSLILFLQYVADAAGMLRIIRWTMGGLVDPGFYSLLFLTTVVSATGAVLFFLSRELNILLTGRERGIALGVDIDRLRAGLFFLTSILVGVIVSICGPIGFVGLMVPHLCRLMLGPDHRNLVPATLFGGGLFLAVCDTIARSAFTVGELPVGILTALLGGPFFLWLLRTSK